MKTKKTIIIASIALISGLASCSKDEPEYKDGPPNSQWLENYAPSKRPLTQFTPDKADWSVHKTKPFKVIGKGARNTSHDPDGIRWLTKESWEKAKWDGSTYNPKGKTKEELYDCMCPSVDQVRGIREVFYKVKPFADNNNPTKAEVDEWHRIAINHVRALVGYNEEERKIKKSHWLFARALWCDERANTNIWDSYPGKNGSAEGPCNGKHGNPHCGDSFNPNKTDRASYLPEGFNKPEGGGKAGGIFSSSKSNIPWSIKWSRSFCANLKKEGFWGGHTGPWFHREKFGFSFWDNDRENNDNIAVLRAKWGGKLSESKYKK